MHATRSKVYLLMVMLPLWGASVLHASPPATTAAVSPRRHGQPATAPRGTEYADFIQLWTSGRNSECARFFAKDNGEPGKITLAEALKRFGPVTGRRIDERTEEETPGASGHQVIRSRSYWVVSSRPDARAPSELLVTDEVFDTYVDEGQMFVADYSATDVTQIALKAAHERIARLEEKRTSTKATDAARISAEIRMCVALCQIQDYEHMWPLVQHLSDVQLPAKSPKDRRVIAEVIRHASRNCVVPDRYADAVKAFQD